MSLTSLYTYGGIDESEDEEQYRDIYAQYAASITEGSRLDYQKSDFGYTYNANDYYQEAESQYEGDDMFQEGTNISGDNSVTYLDVTSLKQLNSSTESSDELESNYVSPDGATIKSRNGLPAKTKLKVNDGAELIDFHSQYFWNEAFQVLLERPTFTQEEAKLRREEINRLCEYLFQAAKPIVKQIISELSVESDKKKIKPVSVGGVAGGEKFITQQLFFKFAKDNIELNLYGGDEWAQKAAEHEIKSLNQLIGASVANLHFPLMCLIRCYGHSLLVVSKLPLGKDTLVYGSADAGYTVQTKFALGQIMQLVAKKLNLKEHNVLEGCTKQLRQICGPVDIEGHEGYDGRYYILDTARLYPPAVPVRNIRGCHLFKLLRPELVQSNPIPLSSDAFSLFGRPDGKVDNVAVKEAHERLFNVLIPNLTSDEILNSPDLTTILHSKGINMRYLGVIYSNFKSRGDHKVMERVLIEMIARSARWILFGQWRQVSTDLDSKCRELAATHFSLLLGKTSSSLQWWKETLYPALIKRFMFNPSVTTKYEEVYATAVNALGSDWIQLVDGHRFELMKRSLEKSGVQLTSKCFQILERSGEVIFNSPQSYHFSADDIDDIEIMVKHVNIQPFLAILKSEGRTAELETNFLNELRLRESKLGASSPQVAMAYRNLATLYAEFSSLLELNSSDQIGKFSHAESYLDKALDILVKYDDMWRSTLETREQKGELYSRYDYNILAQNEYLAVLDSKVKLAQLGHVELIEVAEVSERLARIAMNLKDFQRSLVLVEEALAIKTKEYGPMHWLVARSQNLKSQILFASGDLENAQSVADTVVEILMKTRGKKHAEMGVALDNLAQILSARGFFDEASKAYNKALHVKELTLGKRHSLYAISVDHLATNLIKHRMRESISTISLADVRSRYEDAASIISASLGARHISRAICLSNLAIAEALWGGLKMTTEQDSELLDEAADIVNSTLASNNAIRLIIVKNKELHDRWSRDEFEFELILHSQSLSSIQSPTAVSDDIPLQWRQIFKKLGIDEYQIKNREEAKLILGNIQRQIKQPSTSSSTTAIPPRSRLPAPMKSGDAIQSLTESGYQNEAFAEVSVAPAYSEYSVHDEEEFTPSPTNLSSISQGTDSVDRTPASPPGRTPISSSSPLAASQISAPRVRSRISRPASKVSSADPASMVLIPSPPPPIATPAVQHASPPPPPSGASISLPAPAPPALTTLPKPIVSSPPSSAIESTPTQEATITRTVSRMGGIGGGVSRERELLSRLSTLRRNYEATSAQREGVRQQVPATPFMRSEDQDSSSLLLDSQSFHSDDDLQKVESSTTMSRESASILHEDAIISRADTPSKSRRKPSQKAKSFRSQKENKIASKVSTSLSTSEEEKDEKKKQDKRKKSKMEKEKDPAKEATPDFEASSPDALPKKRGFVHSLKKMFTPKPVQSSETRSSPNLRETAPSSSFPRSSSSSHAFSRSTALAQTSKSSSTPILEKDKKAEVKLRRASTTESSEEDIDIMDAGDDENMAEEADLEFNLADIGTIGRGAGTTKSPSRSKLDDFAEADFTGIEGMEESEQRSSETVPIDLTSNFSFEVSDSVLDELALLDLDLTQEPRANAEELLPSWNVF